MDDLTSRIKLTLDNLVELVGQIAPTKQADESAPIRIGELPYRVIHLKNNPHKQVIEKKEAQYDSLSRENDRLRARLSLIESGNSADVTRRIENAVNSAGQIEQLTKKVNELKAREDKILDSFKKTSREFREVCYLLTGYRIDPLKDDIFRLSHMYAEHEEDKLYFEVKSDGTVNLLKNEFTDRYKEFISTYLEEADSFPAFLAAITLDLFKATTQMEMSMNMSTTMSQDTTIISKH
jgi:mitotic spindle assembly checkpoint protein MAD1